MIVRVLLIAEILHQPPGMYKKTPVNNIIMWFSIILDGYIAGFIHQPLNRKNRIQPPIVFTAGKGRILRACRCFKQGQLIFQVPRFGRIWFRWCVNYPISKYRYPPGYILYIYIIFVYIYIYPIPAGQFLKMMFRTSQWIWGNSCLKRVDDIKMTFIEQKRNFDFLRPLIPFNG